MGRRYKDAKSFCAFEKQGAGTAMETDDLREFIDYGSLNADILDED